MKSRWDRRNRTSKMEAIFKRLSRKRRLQYLNCRTLQRM